MLARKKFMLSTAGVVLALAGATALVAPAWAASYSGSQVCNVAKVAQLSTDAKSPGYGSFINSANTNQSITFGFPAGKRQTLGYQRTLWSVTASGFNAVPFTSCY